MSIHFKYHSGLDVGGGEVSEELFASYIQKFCSLNNKAPENIRQMYQKHFGEDKTLDYPKFMRMIFGDDYELY